MLLGSQQADFRSALSAGISKPVQQILKVVLEARYGGIGIGTGLVNERDSLLVIDPE